MADCHGRSRDALRDLAAHQVELRFTGPVLAAEFEKDRGVTNVVAEDHVLRNARRRPHRPVSRPRRYELADFVSAAEPRRDILASTARRPRGERIMTAGITPAPARIPAPHASPWSRVTAGRHLCQDDARLAPGFISWRALLGGVFVVGAAIPQVFSTPLHGMRSSGWSMTWVPRPGMAGMRSTSELAATFPGIRPVRDHRVLWSSWLFVHLAGSSARQSRIRGGLAFRQAQDRPREAGRPPDRQTIRLVSWRSPPG